MFIDFVNNVVYLWYTQRPVKLKHKPSGESLDAAISKLTKNDFKAIKKDEGFAFDWEVEKSNEVYKIYLLSNEKETLGLMSLIDRKDEYRVHLNLLEITDKHQGQKKLLDRIAGCLIAFAASVAIKRGYYGFVSLEPKTKLIRHYQEHYGFRQYGRYLGIEGDASERLIHKYLGNE